ncbi:MAG: hypothetical protein WBA81_20800, partial [Rhodococcus sp. (in: high G+C Gram-positive bacteria)]
SAPAAQRQPLGEGRHRLDDAVPSSSGHTPPAPTGAEQIAAAASGVAFLTLLRKQIAGAHTRLALLRLQQLSSNSVTASAMGVFESETATTYVLATAHGVSYLARESALPTDTVLLSEVVDDTFYRQWCGYVNPAAKLAAFDATAHDLGKLAYVLTTDKGVALPGIEVVTQPPSEIESIAESKLLAPTARSRRDVVRIEDIDLASEIRQMAMRTMVMSGDQYLSALGRASGALWNNDSDRAGYLEQWLGVLTADALRAVEDDSSEHAWFAVAEFRRATQMSAPRR